MFPSDTKYPHWIMSRLLSCLKLRWLLPIAHCAIDRDIVCLRVQVPLKETEPLKGVETATLLGEVKEMVKSDRVGSNGSRCIDFPVGMLIVCRNSTARWAALSEKPPSTPFRYVSSVGLVFTVIRGSWPEGKITSAHRARKRRALPCLFTTRMFWKRAPKLSYRSSGPTGSTSVASSSGETKHKILNMWSEDSNPACA